MWEGGREQLRQFDRSGRAEIDSDRAEPDAMFGANKAG